MTSNLLDKFFGTAKKEEKKLIEFISPIDASIKKKLHSMASSGGFGITSPQLITIELINKAINEYKKDKGIYSEEISMNSCRELTLSFRELLQISNLENLVNLETLRLDNNKIMKIENLEKLINIKWLDLSFNYISEIEGLDCLYNLTDLSLFSNQITEVKNLDKNRKLNVLSIGNNKIIDCKGMADYLRRFSNLQALCVKMNPFCKDDETSKKSLDKNSNINVYPGSYDPLIQKILTLKYLDWKPISEEYRETVLTNYANMGKEDKFGQEMINEEKKMEERAALHRADLDDIVDFFPKFMGQVIEEINLGVGWDRLKVMPGLMDQLNLAEKGINEDLDKYKKAILEIQKDKDRIMNQHKKELDQNEEKFIIKSKDLIRQFKRVYKSFINDLKKGVINISDIKTVEDTDKYIHIEKLKFDLLEIEVYAKQQISDFIKIFIKDVAEKNVLMGDKTDLLKQSLDAKKTLLKEKISSIVTDIRNQLEAYNELMQEKEGEIIENNNNNNNNKDDNNNNGNNTYDEEDKKKKDFLLYLNDLISMSDFGSDVEKISEILDDRIGKLRDSLESARALSTDTYFNTINTNDYYRNKKRIQDIQEIYDIYWNKTKKVLDDLNKNANNNNDNNI